MSGKSTIIRLLKEGRSISKDDRLNATIDYERHIQVIDDTEITLFDLGGAMAFLGGYKPNPRMIIGE